MFLEGFQSLCIHKLSHIHLKLYGLGFFTSHYIIFKIQFTNLFNMLLRNIIIIIIRLYYFDFLGQYLMVSRHCIVFSILCTCAWTFVCNKLLN